MHLFLETETVVDTNKIMSTVKDSLEGIIVPNGVISDFSKDSCNSYKENLQNEDNIITDKESMNNEDEKIEDEEILLKSPIRNDTTNVATENSGKEIKCIDQEEVIKSNEQGCLVENGTISHEQSNENSNTTCQVTEYSELNKASTTLEKDISDDIVEKQNNEEELLEKSEDSSQEKDELTLLKEELVHMLAEEKSKEVRNLESDNLDTKEKHEMMTSFNEDVHKESASIEEVIKEDVLSVTDSIEAKVNEAADKDSSSLHTISFDIVETQDKTTVGKKTIDVIAKDAEMASEDIQSDNKNLGDNSLLNKTKDSEETGLTTKIENVVKISCSNKIIDCEIEEDKTSNNKLSNIKESISDNGSSNKNEEITEIILTEHKETSIKNKNNLDPNSTAVSKDITKTFPTEDEITIVDKPTNNKQSINKNGLLNKTTDSEKVAELHKDCDVDMAAPSIQSLNKKTIDQNNPTNKTDACGDVKETTQSIDDVDMTTVEIKKNEVSSSSGTADCQDEMEPTDVEMLSVNIHPPLNNNKDSVDATPPCNTTDCEDKSKSMDVEIITEVEDSNNKENSNVTVSRKRTADCKGITEPADVEIATVTISPSNNKESVSVENKDDHSSNRSVGDKELIKYCKEITEIAPNKDTISIDSKEDIFNVDDNKVVEKTKITEHKLTEDESPVEKPSPVICKLSNTLDILSDDDEEPPKEKHEETSEPTMNKQYINIDDDDDIMLIEDTNSNDSKSETKKNESFENKIQVSDCLPNIENKNIDLESGEEKSSIAETTEIISDVNKDSRQLDIDINEKTQEAKTEKAECKKPLLPDTFLKSAKKNLADMTRDDLEEFCILKIVESIVDRSNLSDIKSKLKSMAQNIDEYRKKAMMLTKQNRDLQVVLKSIQEEQKKSPDTPITPLKITRSVGMQVLMTEKPGGRRKIGPPGSSSNSILTRQLRNPMGPSPRQQKQSSSSQNIPVPRLVPANTPAMKPPNPQPVNVGKAPSPVVPNGPKSTSNIQKGEKRPLNRIQSVTVDLTDDEPPAKINARNSPAPPVRLVPSQNLLAPPRPSFNQAINSPRKVYIPISGPQSQNIRPGHTIMLKSVSPGGPRQRCPPPQLPKIQQSQARGGRIHGNRHPAPLPDAMKQYQPPTWKALPPAPDLKLSKVENGIVISWKIEGYQEDGYEEIASYQLYAYQETSSPPSTALWKKIGDVKALPLPMACTLTQFMAGFKYYFAVRAVDVRSRLGPFSLPGSILLLNKM